MSKYGISQDSFEDICRYLNAFGYRSLSQYLKSEHWKNVRSLSIRISGGECLFCKSRKCLNVHHRHYKSLGFENPYRDLLVICNACHKQLHEEAKRMRCEPWRILHIAAKEVSGRGYGVFVYGLDRFADEPKFGIPQIEVKQISRNSCL